MYEINKTALDFVQVLRDTRFAAAASATNDSTFYLVTKEPLHYTYVTVNVDLLCIL